MSQLVWGWSQLALRPKIGFAPSIVSPAAVGRQLITDQGESHAIVFAPTGGGKGRNILIPNLLQWDGPMIAVDIKGELANVTEAYRRSRGHKVIVVDPFRSTVCPEVHGFNPLDALGLSDDELPDRAYMLAAMLRSTPAMHKDPFWEDRAENLIAGVFAFLAGFLTAEQRTLSEAYNAICGAEPLNSLADMLALAGEKNQGCFAYQAISAFLATTDVTRSGILSTAQNMMRVLSSTQLRRNLARSDFDLKEVIDGKPLSIYLVLPPGLLLSHGGVMRLWLSALLSAILSRKTRPRQQTLLLLDEAGQLGPMDQVRAAVTLARGYGLRAVLVFQSYAQLKLIYRDHDSLMDNCGTLATFGHDRCSMSEQIAAALGDISANALFRMPAADLALKLPGHETRIVQRIDYLTDPPFKDRASENPMFMAS